MMGRLAPLLAPLLMVATAEEPVRALRVPLCKAVVAEMDLEIARHSLTASGEDEVWETVPAICIAIVQNYTLRAPAGRRSSWRLERRKVRLDDAVGDEAVPEDFEHLLLLKRACEEFTDEFQHELSGLMFTSTAAGRSAEETAAAFCSSAEVGGSPTRKARRKRPEATSGGAAGAAQTSLLHAKLPGDASAAGDSADHPADRKRKTPTRRGKDRRKKSAASNSNAAGSSPPSMDALLREYDTDGTMAGLLDMERYSPEALLDPDDLAEVEAGARDLRCSVCHTMAVETLRRARKAQVALDDEDALSEITGSICMGVPTGYDDPQNQPKYPGNPPLWVERYRVIKALLAPDGDKNGDDLDRSSRGLATHGDGYVWRLEKARPIGIEESGKGGVTHDDLVMKHAMLSRACKFVESGPNDLAETIFRLAMVSVRRARTSSKRAMGITGKPSVPEGEMPRLKAKDVSDIYCARLCEEAAGWKQQQTSPRPTARASAEDQGPPIGADGGLPLGSKSVAGVSDVPSISDVRGLRPGLKNEL